MENFQVYRDIQARTGGDIYIGVNGPGPYRKIHIYPGDSWSWWHCLRLVREKEQSFRMNCRSVVPGK